MAFHPKMGRGCVRSHRGWYQHPAHRDCTVQLSVVIVCKAMGNVIKELGEEKRGFLSTAVFYSVTKLFLRIN